MQSIDRDITRCTFDTCEHVLDPRSLPVVYIYYQEKNEYFVYKNANKWAEPRRRMLVAIRFSTKRCPWTLQCNAEPFFHVLRLSTITKQFVVSISSECIDQNGILGLAERGIRYGIFEKRSPVIQVQNLLANWLSQKKRLLIITLLKKNMGKRS